MPDDFEAAVHMIEQTADAIAARRVLFEMLINQSLEQAKR